MSAWYESGGDHGSHWRCHPADRINNGGFAGDGYDNGAGHGDSYAGQAYRFDHNPGGSDGSGRDSPFGGAAGEVLGGFIFGCARHTEAECLESGVFGLSAAQAAQVDALTPGLPLFLFNFQTRVMHGVFEATTGGAWNRKPHAFASGRGNSSPYPCQVGVARVQSCPPLSEEEIYPVLAPNYHGDGTNKFRLNLSHQQVHGLLVLFDQAAAEAARPYDAAPGGHHSQDVVQHLREPRKRHRSSSGDRFAEAPQQQAPKRLYEQRTPAAVAAPAPAKPLRLRDAPPLSQAKPAKPSQPGHAPLAGRQSSGAVKAEAVPAAAPAAWAQRQPRAALATPFASAPLPRNHIDPRNVPAGWTTAVLRSLPATATVSGILDEMAGWGVNADAVDFAHGVMLDGARVLVLNFTGTGQLAALHRGAHGKPWSRLLPPGGSGATGAAGAASRPQPQSTGVAAVVFHDPQGRASLQARHGAKAKTLARVSECSHLRLPFAVPLFFRAPAPTAAPSTAGSAAAGPARSAPAAASPAKQAVPAELAAQRSATSESPAKQPAMAAPARPSSAVRGGATGQPAGSAASAAGQQPRAAAAATGTPGSSSAARQASKFGSPAAAEGAAGSPAAQAGGGGLAGEGGGDGCAFGSDFVMLPESPR